jgi:hypothetical protein
MYLKSSSDVYKILKNNLMEIAALKKRKLEFEIELTNIYLAGLEKHLQKHMNVLLFLSLQLLLPPSVNAANATTLKNQCNVYCQSIAQPFYTML